MRYTLHARASRMQKSMFKSRAGALMRPIMPISQSLMRNGSLVGLKFRAGAKISPGPITARSPASKMMPNRMHSLMPLRPGDGQRKGCAPRCGAAMRRTGVPSTDRGLRRLRPTAPGIALAIIGAGRRVASRAAGSRSSGHRPSRPWRARLRSTPRAFPRTSR